MSLNNTCHQQVISSAMTHLLNVSDVGTNLVQN